MQFRAKPWQSVQIRPICQGPLPPKCWWSGRCPNSLVGKTLWSLDLFQDTKQKYNDTFECNRENFFFFLINLFIYLFIFGCVGSSLLWAGFLYLWWEGAALCCSARASHCDGFSCCGARALGTRASVVVACGLSSCGWRALERRLSCSAARGIFLDQGSNPCPLHWQADS